jgi:dihydrodipicolinate synthase/N-acetylneuraminate lyase
MKTSPVTPEDLSRSVIAVPPLCRNADAEFSLDSAENARLIRHLEAGGVSTLLYGGNANLYNIAISEYDALLGLLAETAATDTWIIPSVGPFYGNILDQADILAGHHFPTAMILPTLFPATTSGIQTAVRKFVERSGLPAVLYIKDAAYITPEGAAQLVDEGLISWIKYAIVRPNPHDDPYLAELVTRVDPSIIASGIGEQPTLAHLRDFGVRGFTSGCVCVAPAKSMAVLRALQSADYEAAAALTARFEPLENLRNTHGPIPVLHHAVALAGIADTGPFLPLLSPLPSSLQQQIAPIAKELLGFDGERLSEGPSG